MTPTLHLAALLVAAAPQSPDQPVPLFTNLGTHHFPITAGAQAQAYFDQGIRLTYGFNHAEAIRAFREGARLDPECAMCWWGVALAYGPNINLPMDSASGVEAWRAIQQAERLVERKPPREQAYIRALARRFAQARPAQTPARDSAYARAMGEVARQFPDDQDAQVLYADALMNLTPWNYWMPDGQPRAGTTEFLSRLEGVLARNRDHPGACHFFIHAMEAAHPERAVACAERLASLMPGAGHVVHMPAHIYIRVGRYADAIEANQHAAHADEAYISEYVPAPGLYTGGYYPHNYHFLSFTAILAGQSEVAVSAARKVRETLPPEFVLLAPFLEGMPVYPHLALVSFGRWEEVLGEPMPPGELLTARALAYYARGVALGALGRFDQAQGALDSVTALSQRRRAEVGDDPATAAGLLAVAEPALRGEIALRRGNAAEAVRHFQEAAAKEDAIPYDEPPRWYYPIRQSLGKALLAAGRPADAEQAYREDLKRFPENGWSLFGLAQSLEAQGESTQATDVRARFAKAWAGADVKLTGSRF